MKEEKVNENNVLKPGKWYLDEHGICASILQAIPGEATSVFVYKSGKIVVEKHEEGYGLEALEKSFLDFGLKLANLRPAAMSQVKALK